MATRKTDSRSSWTPEDRARHKAIRERFQKERPNPADLIASGEYNDPIPLGAYYAVRQAVAALKAAREAAGLSLADVAEKSGIDKAALSRLESGQHINPTPNTLWRYAQAVGKRLSLVVEDDSGPGGDGGPRPAE